MHICTGDPFYHPFVIKDKQRHWKRILIVDDNEDIALTFKAGIERSWTQNDNTNTLILDNSLVHSLSYYGRIYLLLFMLSKDSISILDKKSIVYNSRN
jgi:hypothetical protein